MAQGKVTTNGGNLNIRATPSTSTGPIGRIPNGADITITDIQEIGGSKWGSVTYNGVTGYCCISEAGGGNWVSVEPEPTTPTPPAPPPEPEKTEPPSEGLSTGIEKGLTQLMDVSVNNGRAFKGSMRLFGIPFQYEMFIDCRVDSVSNIIGRKFIENFMLEAPIVTIIPGKPTYLPGAKNKRGTTHALVGAASGAFTELATIMKNMKGEELRYFDFQQDYLNYIKYVNAMCRTAAGFLEIGDKQLDGVKLSKYNWRNYRFTSTKYITAIGNATAQAVEGAKGLVSKVADYGAKALEKVTMGKIDLTKEENDSKILFDGEEDDGGVLDAIDSSFENMNFVQFYIDPSASFSASASNSTSTSKLEGLFDQGSDLIKELAFIMNAGGIGNADHDSFVEKSMSALTDEIIKKSNGGIGGVFGRLMSAGSNVLKGNNMIFPEIYQRSDYNQSYSLTFVFKSPYNDVFSYYLNQLVPMLHLLALAIPKQASPNTYSSPFLVKAYLPGVFGCNMGIVESITIDKNVDGEGLSAAGLPTETKVTLTIKDLYSELMMAPSNDPLLFLSNSSLIDFIAINCGIDLVMPQLKHKINYMVNTVFSKYRDFIGNVRTGLGDCISEKVTAFLKI